MIKKEIFKGFIAGIIANLLGFTFCVFIFSRISVQQMTFQETIEASIKNNSIESIIVIGAILNLITFFLFLKQDKFYSARGVLLATLIPAIYIAINKFS